MKKLIITTIIITVFLIGYSTNAFKEEFFKVILSRDSITLEQNFPDEVSTSTGKVLGVKARASVAENPCNKCIKICEEYRKGE